MINCINSDKARAGDIMKFIDRPGTSRLSSHFKVKKLIKFSGNQLNDIIQKHQEKVKLITY